MLSKLASSSFAIFALLSYPCMAQNFPKSGEAGYDTYYLFDTRASIQNDLGNSGIDEFSGITRNVKGESPFNDMSVHCISHWTVIKDDFAQYGTCVETDKDGDNVLTTFDADVHKIVGGTGKYKGITGEASFKVTELHNTVAGRAARVVNHKVKWEFK